MKQTVTLRVPIDDAWDGGDRIQVYTDFGSGTVDTTRPLTARGFDVFPGQISSRGIGKHPAGAGQAGSMKASRPHDGIGSAITGVTPTGTAPPFMSIEVDVEAGFGQWKFAVEAVDRDGTVQAGAKAELQAMVSGTEPSPLKSFDFNNHNGGTDQVTFDFSVNTE